TQKLNHGDLGQMLMYVNYYDKEIKTKEENPTIGLILCTDKNDAVAEYVLDNKRKRIFASRYQYELPTVEELERELRHEMELLSSELLPVKSVQRTPTTRKKSGSVVKKEKRAVK
ncbi:MAG TPA: PDDEXK nuclease domain-containing protein, partial [Chitinispirillaceae bacterium]|nr:PDDEXK nuclease domain-containing protein [Chitinispirillaceae bacterium]